MVDDRIPDQSQWFTKRNYAQEMWDAAADKAREVIRKLDDDIEDVAARYAVYNLFSEAKDRARMYNETIADRSAENDLIVAADRWNERRNERERRRHVEKLAEVRKHWRRVTVDGADITEHVAAMFDAIVGSMDWGSGFLSSEEIESILIVGDVVGFSTPDQVNVDPSEIEPWSGGDRAAYDEWRARSAEAIAAWRAQIKAKAEALRGGGI